MSASAPETRTQTPPPLTGSQRLLAAGSGVAGTALAALGGYESYGAVLQVAVAHDFAHPRLFPFGVDTAVAVLFLTELLLAWLDMPFPPLRWGAWLLVGATVWWNAAASAGNVLGMAMHATAPLLVVVWIEAVRHAVRVRVQMARRRHIEAAQLGRWLLAPLATFWLWRRQQLWRVASLDDALALERRRLLAIARLRAEHGRLWRWKAPVMERLVLRFGLEPSAAPAAADANGQAAPAPAPAGTALATISRPASRRGARALRDGQRGARTEQARQFIAELRAGGRSRPEDLHIVLHRDFGLERTQARRFAERHWPATDQAAGESVA